MRHALTLTMLDIYTLLKRVISCVCQLHDRERTRGSDRSPGEISWRSVIVLLRYGISSVFQDEAAAILDF